MKMSNCKVQECLSYAGREEQYALEEKIKVLADYLIRFFVLDSESVKLCSHLSQYWVTHNSQLARD